MRHTDLGTARVLPPGKGEGGGIALTLAACKMAKECVMNEKSAVGGHDCVLPRGKVALYLCWLRVKRQDRVC